MSFRMRSYGTYKPIHESKDNIPEATPKRTVLKTVKTAKKERLVVEKKNEENITNQFIIGTDTIVYDEKSGIWKIQG